MKFPAPPFRPRSEDGAKHRSVKGSATSCGFLVEAASPEKTCMNFI